MTFYKTLFFEIPDKDFIMPVYNEEDVNVLKSFLQEDFVRFSVGYKTRENEEGFYYIGQVKEITEIFQLSDFPLVYRKRILDILQGLQNETFEIVTDVSEKVVQKLVYFKMTKKGLKPFITEYSLDYIENLKRKDILDYFIKDEKILVPNKSFNSNFLEDEIFYLMKNPNY